MKNKTTKQVSVKELISIAQSTTVKEVSAPEAARRDALTGKTVMDRREATQAWFHTAKAAGNTEGFLSVPKQDIDPKEAACGKMLHKKKK